MNHSRLSCMAVCKAFISAWERSLYAPHRSLQTPMCEHVLYLFVDGQVEDTFDFPARNQRQNAAEVSSPFARVEGLGLRTG